MSDKKAKIPQIRFAGFTGDWEERKLGEVTEQTYGGGTPKTSIVEFWNGEIPWFQSSDLTDGKVFGVIPNKMISTSGLNNSATKLVPENSIAIVTRVGVGKLALIPFSYATSQDFLSLSRLNIDPWFGVYSCYKKLQSELHAVQGTSIKGITKDELLEKKIMAPSIDEQKPIGEFFHHLDNLITLQQRQLDQLASVKKTMLAKMFPKDGANVPEIRFAGFTGAWEERKLRELTSLITKGTTPVDKSGNGNINFVKIENIDSSSGEIRITSKISEEEHNGYLKRSQLQEDDILFSIAGTLGRVTSVKKSILPANTNQALAIIRLKANCLDYIKTYLKGKAVADFIKKNPTIGAQPNLSLEQVGSLDILLPSLEEQQVIGTFFRNLDNLIYLHQRELDALKTLKKSMLQQLFV